MNFVEYAPLARRTLKELPFQEHLNHMAMGFTGEMGELIDAFKKHVVYGKPLDSANVLEEIGDMGWYVVNLCKELEVDPAELDTTVSETLDTDWTESGWETLGVTEKLLHLNQELGYAGVWLSMDLEQGEDTSAPKSKLDLMRYLAGILVIICDTLKVDLYEALDVNIAKLAKRYGDKYSDYAALNRDLTAEREILEAGVK